MPSPPPQTSPSRRVYWFAAKRYGWGWGLPTCWQGWAVVAGDVALVAACAGRWPPRHEPVLFGASLLVCNVLLVLVCWAKGEPAAWRWGGR